MAFQDSVVGFYKGWSQLGKKVLQYITGRPSGPGALPFREDEVAVKSSCGLIVSAKELGYSVVRIDTLSKDSLRHENLNLGSNKDGCMYTEFGARKQRDQSLC